MGYNTGVGHLAAAASCGAGGPEAPVSSEAVYWAFLSGTFGPLLKHGAVLAAVHGLGQDLTVTHPATRATALGALAKFGPIGHFAVGRAGLGLAHLLLLHGTTSLPIVKRLHRQDTVTVLNTLTTTFGTFGVKPPRSELAVDRAGTSLAGAGLGKNTTFLAAVTGFGDNLAGAGGLATSTGPGASSPLAPLAHLAVDCTGLELTLNGLFKARASTVVIVHHDGASAALVANTANLGAGGICTPFRNLAVYSAFASKTLVALGERWALLATMSSNLNNLASAFHRTIATHDVACRVRSPRADTTVHWAGLDVAVTGGFEGRAGSAAVLCFADDLAGGKLSALAAGGGAGRPDGPGTNLAVVRAETGFADFLLAQMFAFLAAIHSVRSDLTGTNAAAKTTGLGARAPLGEFTEFTVVGALLGVALAALRKSRALLDSIFPGVTLDGTLTGLHTAGIIPALAGAGARSPRAEFGDFTVHGALVSVAISLCIDCATLAAAVSRFGDDATSSFLRPTATGQGALGPCFPFIHDAVHRALLHVATATLLEGTTGLATVSGFDQHLAGTGMSATTALFGAWDPLGPYANFAMDRAVLAEAFLLLRECGADVTSVLGMSGYLTAALLDALAAGLAARGPCSPFRD